MLQCDGGMTQVSCRSILQPLTQRMTSLPAVVLMMVGSSWRMMPLVMGRATAMKMMMRVLKRVKVM